jgi:crossover junction endodeoxyribonuclease RusA
MSQHLLFLPWPPSLNRYWRNVHGRTLISAEGRDYRGAVVTGLKRFGGAPALGAQRLSVHIIAAPPDKRRRDLDNLLKAALDALTHAGVWDDDGQIDRLLIQRGPVTPGGSLRIEVEAGACSTLLEQNAQPSASIAEQVAA